VYKKLLGIPFSLADLVDVDPDLYRGFVDLLAFTGKKQCVSSVNVCMCVAALCPDNMQQYAVYECVSPPCYWLCRPYISTASKWGRDCMYIYLHVYV
jgi:hypothetical protein